MKDRFIGFVLFPRLAALDIVGPYEVLGGLASPGNPFGFRVVWLAETLEPVVAHQGMTILPGATFDNSPDLEILVVPGGPGQADQMHNEKMMAFLKRAGARASIVASVCTGSLLLAKAGFLNGKRATTHWMVKEELKSLGALVVDERVVRDGDVITGAGVSAGIDMALTLAADLAGPDWAEAIQLNIEYDPQPPFDSGSPSKARPEIIEAITGTPIQAE